MKVILGKFIRHEGDPWQSQEMQRVVDNLDQKLDRCHDNGAKKMCLETFVEGESTREKPDYLPLWATKLFSYLLFVVQQLLNSFDLINCLFLR